MNQDELQRTIRWGTIAVLVGVAILFAVLDGTGNTERFFEFARNPFTAVLSFTSSSTDSAVDAITGPLSISAARQELADLQTRVDELERENEELREVQSEYQLLLALFNRASQDPDISRLTAAVIGRDTSPSLQSIIVDRGKAENVQVGMPVESARGLVGQVFRTTNDASQVVLITDNASSIPVRLGSSRATGLLRGGGLGSPMVIEWIDLKYQIEVGEVVLTSGLGGKFPQDLAVGRVIEVDRREADLFQRAVVQPAVDFNALEIVFIITGFLPVNTDIFASPPG